MKNSIKNLLELRTHGITRDASIFQNSVSFAAGQEVPENSAYPGWYMEMQTLGYNYRFTDFQAALGISQLSRAHQGLERRKAIAENTTSNFRIITTSKGILALLKATLTICM